MQERTCKGWLDGGAAVGGDGSCIGPDPGRAQGGVAEGLGGRHCQRVGVGCTADTRVTLSITAALATANALALAAQQAPMLLKA